jgi:hypothetical protein
MNFIAGLTLLFMDAEDAFWKIIICSYDGGYRVVYGGVTILPLVTIRG